MSVIEYKDINTESIGKMLEGAGLPYSVDEDDDIYIDNTGIDFGLFLKIDNDKKHIHLHTYMQCKEGAPHDELVGFVNALNERYMAIQFTSTSYDDGRAFVNGSYFYFTPFGVLVPQLIYTIKKISSVFISAIKESDEDDIFFD